MKYTHLRPGNIVEMLFVGPDPYWSWSYFKVSDYDGIQKHPHIYRPITITEEWMVRFGYDTKKKYLGMDYGLFITEEDGKFIMNAHHHYNTTCEIELPIEYVHQL